MRNRITVTASLSILFAAPVQAQFAPEGATADPNNPSSATITKTRLPWEYTVHLYYDCLKRKWVVVLVTWRTQSRNPLSGMEPSGPPSGPLTAPEKEIPPGGQLPSGPPPGALYSPGDPEHAFNPKTGENFAQEPDGSWIDVKTGKVALAPKLCPCPEPQATKPPPPPPPAPGPKLDKTSSRILDIHNEERFAVGAPPLRWDSQLAAGAAAYAAEMARTGQLIHAPREGRGIVRENINEAFHGSGPDQLMANWLNEKRYFHPGIFPNVCVGDWFECAHYSQMIWPTTQRVGCGSARGVQWDFFVCRYSPGGNKDGKPVGMPQSAQTIADHPAHN